MAFNFLDTVKGFFSDDLVNKAAGYLGENETALRKGIDAVVPVSLAGIISKAQSSPESLLNLAKEALNSGILTKIGDAFRSGGSGVPAIGPTMISGILGDKFGTIANTISSETGLKGSTTSSLFGTIVPLALGVLGKQATDSNLSPGSLATLLGSQKSTILSMIPSGLKLSGLPGFARDTVSADTPGVPRRKTNRMLPVLLGIAALLLLWWLFRKPQGKDDSNQTVAVSNMDTQNVRSAGTGRESVRLRLPNGVELDAYKGGMEDQLLAFLNDPSAAAGKDNWFDFNNLNFKFGTAEIVPESRAELDNITKILQAYPKVKVKIGGYTDKVGDAAANKKLSHERAKAVADALRGAGLTGQVLGEEGYGSEFAKYPADAPEEDRIKDRRISLSVREK